MNAQTVSKSAGAAQEASRVTQQLTALIEAETSRVPSREQQLSADSSHQQQV